MPQLKKYLQTVLWFFWPLIRLIQLHGRKNYWFREPYWFFKIQKRKVDEPNYYERDNWDGCHQEPYLCLYFGNIQKSFDLATFFIFKGLSYLLNLSHNRFLDFLTRSELLNYLMFIKFIYLNLLKKINSTSLIWFFKGFILHPLYDGLNHLLDTKKVCDKGNYSTQYQVPL